MTITGQNSTAFRMATEADIPLIRSLADHIWRTHYPGIITHAQIDYMLGKMYSPETIADEIDRQGYTYLLALRNGEPVGFAAFLFEPAITAVKISKLYLLPLLHGKGIGQEMLQWMQNDAIRRAATRMYLFVNKNNAKAIAAYERFGFVKAAAVVTDIGGGFVMDDYRMELDIERFCPGRCLPCQQ